MACGMDAGGYGGIYRATGETGINRFGVADLAGFVDFLAGQADVGSGGSGPVCNSGSMLVASLAAVCRNLTPLLREIVFVGEATFGSGHDFK